MPRPAESKSQCAAIELKFNTEIDRLREEAKERQRQAGEEYGRGGKVGSDLTQANTGRLKEKLAENAGVGPTSMTYLMAVQRDAPDLFEEVLAGENTPKIGRNLTKQLITIISGKLHERDFLYR